MTRDEVGSIQIAIYVYSNTKTSAEPPNFAQHIAPKHPKTPASLFNTEIISLSPVGYFLRRYTFATLSEVGLPWQKELMLWFKVLEVGSWT